MLAPLRQNPAFEKWLEEQRLKLVDAEQRYARY